MRDLTERFGTSHGIMRERHKCDNTLRPLPLKMSQAGARFPSRAPATMCASRGGRYGEVEGAHVVDMTGESYRVIETERWLKESWKEDSAV